MLTMGAVQKNQTTSPRQKVTPARANQPGYDADIATTLGTTYRTSLKRYSQSAHEKLFLKKSNNTELRFINALRKTRFDALLYVKAKNYPSESNWQNLYAEIDQLVSNFNGIKQIVEIEGFWLVGLLPLAEENDEVFSKNHNSYSFVCASPYHNNEQQNFTSKLESAVSNLERHVVTGSNYVPIIIMQLPVTACALTLTNWTNEYINKNSESALEAVFFLQPFTASNAGGASSHIAHFTSVACSQSFRKESRQMLQLDFPVGIITQTPPHWKLHSDIGETQLLNHYVYQKGRHFITAQQDSSGASSANISRKAPGIESIAVFELYGQQMVLQGSFGEDLCLIGG
jgi:hypothetical protein